MVNLKQKKMSNIGISLFRLAELLIALAAIYKVSFLNFIIGI